jgi:predicted alpha/beta superfamily hydrolase
MIFDFRPLHQLVQPAFAFACLLGLGAGGSGQAAPVRKPGLAAVASKPILLGETISMNSRIMGETRVINVWLPDGYVGGKARYPVLYLLDGGVDQDFLHVVGANQLGAVWGRSQPAIVVGIASRDRRNELVGPTTDPELLKRYPTAGQSERFRRHIAEEVKPLINARFRTNGDDAVMGESLAGLFVVETWLRQPGLFKRYAAISPSLWWDKEKIRTVAAEDVAHDAAWPPILLASENEGEELALVAQRFVAAMPNNGQSCHVPQPYNHANIYHAATPMALQFLFPPAEAPDPKFGFEVPCSRKS